MGNNGPRAVLAGPLSIITRGSIAIMVVLLCLAVQARAADAPTPVLTLDTASALPGGKFAVKLWFVGEQVDKVSNVRVSMTGSDWVSMQPNPSASLQAPWPASLTLDVTNSVAEGTSTLVFAIHYDVAQDGGKVVAHDAVIQKPIELGLLGTGSIEGLPLQLVSLIIPGLFGVVILRLRNSKLWEVLSGAAEKAGGGLLLSLAALWLLQVVAPHTHSAALMSPGMSRMKLAAAAVAGCLIAAVLILCESAVLGLCAARKRRREQASRLQPGDSFAVAAAKAIDALCTASDAEKANWVTPTVAELPGGKKLIGSTVVRNSDDRMVLIGWGNVSNQQPLRDLLWQSVTEPGFAAKKKALGKVAAGLRGLSSGLTLESPVRQLEPASDTDTPIDLEDQEPLEPLSRVREARPEETKKINSQLGAIPLRRPASKVS